MVEVTAAMVKELRLKTDAPLLECKKALVEADGDLVRAEEVLRVRLGNRAVKAASRIAAEGAIVSALSPDGSRGVLLEVNCETDFVSKNESFIEFCQAVAQAIREDSSANNENLGSLRLGETTVEEARVALVGRIGENITVRRFLSWTGSSLVTSYVHGGRVGVLVDYDGDPVAARDVAMHIVASRPLCVSRDDVPSDLLQRERLIYEQQAAQSGKPEAIVTKMVEGRLSRFLSEISLLDQPFVKDPENTVAAWLRSSHTVIRRFQVFVVGAGIEKENVNFAEEVAAVARHD